MANNPPSLRDLYRHLSNAGVTKLATKAGTTPGFLRQVALYDRRVSLGLADALVAAAPSDARLSVDGIPLTPAATRQLLVRRGKPHRYVYRSNPRAAR